MKLNIYEYEVVTRKTVKIAARSETLAHTCLIGREDDAVATATLHNVQKDVDVKTMTFKVVDCISFTEETDAQ